MKAMEHLKEGSTVLAICIGVITGIIKFLDVYLLTDSYILALFKSGFTAFVCGIMGVAGKFAFDYGKKMYLKYKNKKP